MGDFTLDHIADTILEQEKGLIPYVHELITPVATCQLYYDGEEIYIELWPGIGASTKQVYNDLPDIIMIKDKIRISRVKKIRNVENVNRELYNAEPLTLLALVIAESFPSSMSAEVFISALTIPSDKSNFEYTIPALALIF